MRRPERPNWGTLALTRREGTAPPARVRQVESEPAVDVEAELDRLAAGRDESWLREVLDAEES